MDRGRVFAADGLIRTITAKLPNSDLLPVYFLPTLYILPIGPLHTSYTHISLTYPTSGPLPSTSLVLTRYLPLSIFYQPPPLRPPYFLSVMHMRTSDITSTTSLQSPIQVLQSSSNILLSTFHELPTFFCCCVPPTYFLSINLYLPPKLLDGCLRPV